MDAFGENRAAGDGVGDLFAPLGKCEGFLGFSPVEALTAGVCLPLSERIRNRWGVGGSAARHQMVAVGVGVEAIAVGLWCVGEQRA